MLSLRAICQRAGALLFGWGGRSDAPTTPKLPSEEGPPAYQWAGPFPPPVKFWTRWWEFTDATAQYAAVAAFRMVEAQMGPVADPAEMPERIKLIYDRLVGSLLETPYHNFPRLKLFVRAEAEAVLAGMPTPMTLEPDAPSVRLARAALGQK